MLAHPNPRRPAALAAALAALLAPAARSQATTSRDTLAEITSQGLEQSRVMEWQDYLCNHIGARLTGSDAFTEACEWARAELAAMGLEARLEPWDEWKLVWNRGQWAGRMVEPEPLELQVATPAWTAPTKGQVRGELVEMPTNASEVKKLEKRIADRDAIWLYGPRNAGQDKSVATVREWIEQGAVLGTVQSAESTGWADKSFENQIRVFGDRNVALASWESRPRTPHVIVRDDQAKVLEKRLAGRKKVIVDFEIRNRFRKGPITLHNVVADLKGSEHPDEIVVVCAHLDSWHQATGATDNGTGVCTTLEAARILTAAGARPKRTIRFILWGGEEQGLLGSQKYVVQNRAGMHRFSAVFNHDSGTNWAHSLTVTEAIARALKPAFAPIFQLKSPNPKHAGPAFVLETTAVMQPAGGGSDHASFATVGVPAWSWRLLGERPYGYGWHSQWDTYDIVVPEYQAHNATVIAHAAFAVANLPELLPREGVERRAPSGEGDAAVLVEALLGVELEGMRVHAVSEGGLFVRAKGEVGDIVVELFGEAVASPVDMARLLREKRDEAAFTATVERAGKRTALRAAR